MEIGGVEESIEQISFIFYKSLCVPTFRCNVYMCVSLSVIDAKRRIKYLYSKKENMWELFRYFVYNQINRIAASHFTKWNIIGIHTYTYTYIYVGSLVSRVYNLFKFFCYLAKLYRLSPEAVTHLTLIWWLAVGLTKAIIHTNIWRPFSGFVIYSWNQSSNLFYNSHWSHVPF